MFSANGPENPNWKGEKAGKYALHVWVRNHKQEPQFCEKCGKKPPVDLHNIPKTYKRNLEDWIYVCFDCHKELEPNGYGKRKHTEEEKKIRSNRMTGTGNTFYGKKHSIETKEKMKNARLGKHFPRL